MSKPTQWTTTYSSVFRDRRRYAAPESAPSDPSWNVRTQGYYGTRADLAEHAARTAEVEARTEYGARPLASAHPQANTSRVGMGMSGAGTFALANGGPNGNAPPLAKFAPQPKDLWTHPILPHNGAPSSASPSATNGGGFGATSRSGYGGGQQQWQEPQQQQPKGWNHYQPQQQQQEDTPQQHIPGYQGFIRGSQFVHGDTYGRTTRQCLSNPTSMPIEP